MTQKPIVTSYVAPSAVPDSMNPGYKVYHVDGKRGADSTWELVNHETWILNITDANIKGNTESAWFKEFSAKETYGLKDLRPESYYDFVLRMVDNRTLFETFNM